MAVRIRLARYGRTHRPYYRVVAIDSREHREGRACETLGTYDPLLPEKNVSVDIERVHAWVLQGARLNRSVETLLKHFGYQPYPAEAIEKRAVTKAKAKAKWAKRRKTENKGFVAVSRRAIKKHQGSLKAARLQEQSQALEAHRAARAAAEASASQDDENAEQPEG